VGLVPAPLLHPGGFLLASEVFTMIGFNNNAGSIGDDSSNSSSSKIPSSSNDAPSPSRRGRARSADFGMPERSGLLDLARTYLETQNQLWPELADTTAVPAPVAATITAMADDFEKRFRQQHAETFRPGDMPKVWTDLGIAYLRFSDENSNPRSLDQQLLNVLTRARRGGLRALVFRPRRCRRQRHARLPPRLHDRQDDRRAA